MTAPSDCLNWVGIGDLPGFCRAAVAGLAIIAVTGCDDDIKADGAKNARDHKPVMIAEAVEVYRAVAWVEPHMIAWVREQLKGKNLACWCKLDQPCHADVLLEIANDR